MTDDARIEVDNDELLTPRDFRREFATRLQELEDGEKEKLVLIRGTEMVAVVIPIDEYARLKGKPDE